MGCSSSTRTPRYKGAGVKPSDIISEYDMISERAKATGLVDDVLTVSKDIHDEYGAQVGQFMFAEMKRNASAIAYYDAASKNIAVNDVYVNQKALADAYDECVKHGFHPSNGNKSAMQAVAAHEWGHALTDIAAEKMGIKTPNSLHVAADRIVNEARRSTKHRGVVQMSAKISEYATMNSAEAIAEAFSDVYCNGKNAKSESHAIINTLNKYIKR